MSEVERLYEQSVHPDLEQSVHPDLVGRLRARVQRALAAARARNRDVLLSVSAEAPSIVDPSAVVFGSRSAGESWFSLEQPDRGGLAIAGVGCTIALEADGPDRFTTVATRWRKLAADAVVDDSPPIPGAGLAAMGGFAFAPDGGRAHAWRGFAPASLAVPAVGIARHHGRTWVTANLLVRPQDSGADLVEGVEHRLSSLRQPALPLLDPAPVGTYDVVSAMPPAHYEQAVGRAVERIRAGAFQKVVLAREVDVHAPRAHDPAAVFGVLREAFATSFVYAVGRGDTTFIGATPELLIRRQGQRASTVALAGSARRSADPSVDAHLGEQLLRSDKNRAENAIVARRVARALRPVAVWVTAADEPVLTTVANIQHLATPIRAQLSRPVDAVTLAGMLHPTPAVGAEPAAALSEIPALEGFDRGWYAGAIGWVDCTGDGEYCVALRCALLHGHHARCYAGCGIVADSEPSAELAESEIKLQVMLPVLTG